MANSAAPPTAKRDHWLINRNFASLWVGQLISLSGDYLVSTTAILWITQRLARGQSWAPLAVSGELIAVTAPTLLLGPLAGVFVDRWQKRQTMLAMDLIRAVLLGVLALLALEPLSSQSLLIVLYTTIVLASACSQFFNPARLALLADIVAPEDQTRAGSLLFMTVSLGIILGPAIAAPLYFAVGPAWALGADATSFLVSFAAIRRISVPRTGEGVSHRAQQHIGREFATGLRLYGHSPVLRTLLFVTALTLLGSSAINALGIFFLTMNLHGAPPSYGLLSVATGVGVLLGSVVATWAVPRLGAARSFWVSTLFVGVLLVLYARQTAIVPAMAVLCIIGLPSAGINAAIGPLILQSTPRELVGRVYAIFAPATNLAALLGAAGVGVLASTALRDSNFTVLGVAFGPYDTVYMLAGVAMLLSGVYAWHGLHAVHPPTAITVSETA